MVACSPKEEESQVPKNLIPEDQMISILTDVHLIEGSRTGMKVMGDTVTIAHYYQVMFSKHNITKDQYDSSFSYYVVHTKKMDLMYEKVIENLNKLEAERTILMEEEDQ